MLKLVDRNLINALLVINWHNIPVANDLAKLIILITN